jgi:hypothetical protein
LKRDLNVITPYQGLCPVLSWQAHGSGFANFIVRPSTFVCLANIPTTLDNKILLTHRFSALWRRNFILNFSTPCIQNVNNTGTKKGSIMK